MDTLEPRPDAQPLDVSRGTTSARPLPWQPKGGTVAERLQETAHLDWMRNRVVRIHRMTNKTKSGSRIHKRLLMKLRKYAGELGDALQKASRA